MLRRFLAAAFLVFLALLLLLMAWPQLVGMERTFGFAQVVSLRGGLVAIAALGILVAIIVLVLAPPLRRFAASVAALLLVFALLNVAVLQTRGLGDQAFETPGDSTITVLAWNTLGDAPGATAVAELVEQTGADVVVLPETTAELRGEVEDILEASGTSMQGFTLAYDQISKARSTSMLVSRDLGEYVLDGTVGNSAVLPSLVAKPVDGNGPTLVGIHLVAPIPGEFDRWQQDVEWAATACADENVIMAGDFNATLDHFTNADEVGHVVGECVDAAQASDNGGVGTWPTDVPALLGAPIDHVLATTNWQVTGMRVIESHDKYGSDHRPVLAQLAPAG